MVWFDPSLFNEPPKQSQSDHTHACKTIAGDTGRPICDMDMVDQDFVLECKHRSHLSVRQLFRVWSDTPLNADVEEGKLF